MVSPCTTPSKKRGSVGEIVGKCGGGFTCEIFAKLVLHLESPFEGLLRLFVGHAAVHFPAEGEEVSNDHVRRSLRTHIIDSMDFGLMKIAIGYN
jgi:hypothetical protein